MPINLELLMSYLSGAGKAIGTGKHISEGLDPITQKQIAGEGQTKLTEKYLQQLSKMLGGDVDSVPPGSKMSIDETGMTFKLPKIGAGRRGEDEQPTVIQPLVPQEEEDLSLIHI